MKRSINLTPGIWQFEFTDDSIAVAKWDTIPTSTIQWIVINDNGYFTGTSINDIMFVKV